jgi:hypothetical protein
MDPYAQAHRIPVEQVKPPEERGRYVHPELYGQPSTLGMAPVEELRARLRDQGASGQ